MDTLHMKKGTGEASYAQNSMLQRFIISMTKQVVEEAILKILNRADDVPDTFGVADLGCGSGPNTLLAMSEIIKVVHTRCQVLGCRVPELIMSLNDLPDNDFNSVFASLPEFYKALKIERESCLFSGVPTSFYGGLFPKNSLYFVHSSSSLHWLSQVPPSLVSGKYNNKPSIVNKRNVYISKTSPEGVVQAYVEQFQTDFKVFLESRSAEVVYGGRMVLSLYGRISPHPTDENAIFDLFNQVLITLVSKGVLEEEMMNSFNVPIYKPCTEEIKTAIQKEGSFAIDRLESFQFGLEDLPSVNNASDDLSSTKKLPKINRGQQNVTIMRAIFESLIESHFGMQILNDIYRTTAMIYDENPAKYPVKYVNIVASLIRK